MCLIFFWACLDVLWFWFSRCCVVFSGLFPDVFHGCSSSWDFDRCPYFLQFDLFLLFWGENGTDWSHVRKRLKPQRKDAGPTASCDTSSPTWGLAPSIAPWSVESGLIGGEWYRVAVYLGFFFLSKNVLANDKIFRSGCKLLNNAQQIKQVILLQRVLLSVIMGCLFCGGVEPEFETATHTRRRACWTISVAPSWSFGGPCNNPPRVPGV